MKCLRRWRIQPGIVAAWTFGIALAVATIAPVVYSYVLYRKLSS
ncbi:hypothetical protein [Effusibacillus pohliae]|nr:hypothetical protein [Effusibacillus pohliae]